MADGFFKRIGVFLERARLRELGGVNALLRSRFFSWLAVILLAFVATLLSTVSFQRIPSNLKEGMIVARDIKADRNYEIVDEEATRKFKEEATSGVIPVYDFDDRVSEAILKRIHDAFSAARDRLDAISQGRAANRSQKQAGPSDEEASELEAVFSEKLGVALPPAQWSLLVGERFSERLEASVAMLLRRAMSLPVVAERGSLDALRGKGIVLRRIRAEGGEGQQIEEKSLDDVSRIISTEEARKRIAESQLPPFGFKSPDAPAAASALAQLLAEPNCSISMMETERRRGEAALNVKNVILKMKAGEMIVREGSRYEPWHIKVLEGIRKEKRRGMYSFELIGTFMLVLSFIAVPFYLSQRSFRRARASRSDFVLMAVVGLAILGIMRLSLLLAPAIQEALFPGVSVSSLNYAIPVAGGAMLLRMFLGAEITFVFAVVISALIGLFVGTDMRFAVFCFISSFAAIIAIARADRRSLIIKAGAATGAAGAFALVGIRLIDMASATEAVTIPDVLWSVLFAFLGGLGSSIFTMIVAPLVESASDYTSDIKLLELANLNHPLLRELIVRAPGTYHHSHMAGILGEAAAEAIGANALLVRVSAYYHDIGKIRKPLYFIENARAGENKHEKLSPHMSALIVAAHVKDGVEMAEKESVPRAIIDMIPQHHGTRLISFFYEKAKGQEDQSVQKVDTKDFVYPGPKPQTREAAILMLSDAAEAATRALKEKSTTRIQHTVQRVVTDIFMEKQLDECELTLKDLNDIARAFARILLGIYHARIEYPKDTEHEKPEISIVDESSTNMDLPEERPPGHPPKSRGG